MAEPDWLDEREQRAWRGYLALNDEIQRRMARQLLRETGLTGAEYSVLVSLSEAPGGRLRVFQLRHAAEWEKTRLTHQITRMVARGLVAREPCPDDSRGAFVVLTEAGWEAVTAAAPRHVAHVRHWFFDALKPEQVDALIDISRSVLTRLPEADRVMGEPCTRSVVDGALACGPDPADVIEAGANLGEMSEIFDPCPSRDDGDSVDR
ncbi:MarR family winged helix-turn-helix transcriptional regulator [Dactylosporangium sp. NPDC000555]|uniref:MarR family winged helix-turn-helix transcriptional regulator n=1 Tax=Dactylosporangium sp. NPDC000555 TaxID=3154260 RepID=UPI00331FC91D